MENRRFYKFMDFRVKFFVNFPIFRRIGKTATALVKKLCRDNPAERLGSGIGGVNDIR